MPSCAWAATARLFARPCLDRKQAVVVRSKKIGKAERPGVGAVVVVGGGKGKQPEEPDVAKVQCCKM